MRLTGFNQRSGKSFVQDTTLRLEAGADSEFLTGSLEVPLAPGTWTVGLLGDQGTEEAGFYTFRRGLRIDGGDGLRMSDVVLGLDRWRPLWHHAGGDVPVSPYPAWRSAASIELYAEVGGIQMGSSYRTTIEIVPATPGRRGVKIRSESKAANSIVEIRRTLSIAILTPGPYRLSVTVESGGRTTSREQEIVIVK
jgi:hypothetical protein